MPDILKINGRCGSRIADVNGVLKGNIQDVNNVGGFVAYSPPLDTYGSAAAAYSVRLLRTAYTGDCMRVRRASDNVEADIAFDAGELKLTSSVSNTSDAQSYTDFADFVGHTGTPTDAFCRTWYDQSGNAKDASQSTAPSQPQIYDATTGLIEEGSIGNEKPALIFSTHSLSTSVSLSQPYTGISVGGIGSGIARFDALYGTSLARGPHIRTQLSPYFYGLYSGVVLQGSTGATSQDLITALYNSTTSTMHLNGASDASGNIGTNNPSNLEIGNANQNWDGQIQEIILYDSDQSSNRSGIECNTNGYFKIY